MERQGLNNPRLAQKAGISEKTVSRLINARKDPRLNTLERVGTALGLGEAGLLPSGETPDLLGQMNGDGRSASSDLATQLAEINQRLAAMERALEKLVTAQAVVVSKRTLQQLRRELREEDRRQAG